MKNPSLRSEILLRVALVIFGVCVSAILLEGAFRLLPFDWSEERARFNQYDPEIGWRGKPGAAGTFRTPDFTTWVAQNSRGLRSSEVSYTKGDDEKRILVLGDSFAWGYGVNAEDSFTSVLQRELPDSNVINAGCSGYGTDQELLFFRSEGRKYSADVVIVALHLRSDIKNNITSRAYNSFKPVLWSENGKVSFENIPVVESSRGYAAMRFFKRNSAFFVWMFGRQIGERKVGEIFADGVNFVVQDAEPKELVSPLTSVEATCKLAAMVAHDVSEAHAHPVFVVIPDILPETRAIQEKAEFTAIRECLKDLPAMVIDLSAPLQAALETDRQIPVVFQHDLHWTPAGHAVVGREIAAALKMRYFE